MRRRTFSALGAVAGATTFSPSLLAAARKSRWDAAAAVLEEATQSKQVAAAALHVVRRGEEFSREFGDAKADAMFLLGSISKPINIAAVMSVVDEGELGLDDPIGKFIPEFKGEGRERVALRHVLTHVSGLPDQLPENNELRKRHAPLADFVAATTRTPLAFAPGARYQYSSMGVLLAARVAEIVAGVDIATLVHRRVFKPLEMKRSAQGLGAFQIEDFVRCQTDGAAPESGGGDPTAKDWDWNSRYWRSLGAPWGGTHASAADVAAFLGEFLGARGKVVKPDTARLMIRNHNPAELAPRGLGFAVGAGAGSMGCSERTFGHSGSTGTYCWADPATETICVVLTSLPSRAAKPHPMIATSDRVAQVAGE